MQIAETGDIIEFKGGMQGRVQKVNQNSVIVDITIMKNFRELDMEPLTVVSHKTILSLIKMHNIIERACIVYRPFLLLTISIVSGYRSWFIMR